MSTACGLVIFKLDREMYKCDLSFNPTSNIDGLKTEKEWRVDPDTFGSETACVRASYQEVQIS